jgi:UDP-N-acetylglucosamine--N-acetylmuramyl-(pentapeptide) pyrophosphoryl-undecaprenol N-acetylglucosamine transferase
MTKKKILIATGGTGGHVFPAYSLANYLENKDYKIKLTSDKRGLSYLKDYKRFNLIRIPSTPLLKNNIFNFLSSITAIVFSTIKSFFLLLIQRPAIVFGMGGYSSFPVCIAASILRIKFVIYENNLILGKANKYLLPFANKIFVAYKDLEGVSERHKKKVIEIGNIVREQIINSTTYNLNFKNFDSIKILILGGSQAARVFADELPEIFVKLKKSKFSIKIYQQCQENQNDNLSNFYKKNSIDYELFNFKENIIDYYLKANLVITRSGASALGELINIKIPFISIPLPSSADNHQYKNAEYYKKKGYGYLLEEKDIKNKLYNLINSIFINKSLIKNILSNQSQYSDKDIYNNLNNKLEKIINEKN